MVEPGGNAPQPHNQAAAKGGYDPEVFREIITQDQVVHELFRYITSIGRSLQPVLLTGETGVGKELFAKAVHATSGLSGELVILNVAGLDDNVFSDTLFGHVKGAFTGAEQARYGLVEKAAGGTLVLDEIGDLSLASQVKLLRLIQEGEYMPLGSDEFKEAYIRVVAVTNKNLWQLQRSGQFRDDLNFRIRTHHIHVPSLKERQGDLPLLVDHFLEQAALAMRKEKPELKPDVLPGLAAYGFPGNIRELQAMVFDAVSSSAARKLPLELFRAIIAGRGSENGGCGVDAQLEELTAALFLEGFPTLHKAAGILVLHAMKLTDNNVARAASLLGISRQALSKRLHKLGWGNRA